MTVFEARPAHIPFRFAFEALGLNRSTVYAWRRRQSTAPDPARRSLKTTPQPRALSTSEQVQIRERMNEPEFCDQTPYQVYHKLLDRVSPMIAENFLDLMADVGVVCSHGRPRVSNDNPFSESQFKTLKTQPDFPGRFDSPESARLWAVDYFCWYSHEHHHSGLAGFTTAQVYTGNYKTVRQVRQATLDRYYKDHPERFCQWKPRAALPPEAVHINPITSEAPEGETSTAVNFPTLPAARKALERANRG
ncbi:integrase core domain-containing protein [Marinobacter sp. BSs20148]|jgi:hypothetical protein|uniref:integrase core domain-containing protein n=1 Tax=Marinobacter sp. BSs20148 TaxID=490759 RepID=UPI0002777436|nr:hypothetical protein MRBBS_3389 [Marinobacter sp. BSs20148]